MTPAEPGGTSAPPIAAAPIGLVRELVPDAGVWRSNLGHPALDGSQFEVLDPSTGTALCQVSDAGAGDAVLAVDSAHEALPTWGRFSPRERSEVLRRAYELMMEDQERLAALISWENGKALPDARAEVAYAAEFFRWFSEEAVRTEGRYGVSPAGDSRTVVTHRPVGVAALVTPWNFPAAMATRKIAPALAAGCSVVLKPAAETPLSALAVARILGRAGAPDGVVNVVPTSRAADVVTAWMTDDRVRKLSFTGSTPVGRVLLRQAADRVVNTSMELGGNAPFVVTEDADVARAVEGAMTAKYRNGGQACTAADRFYVHEAVADSFARLFAAASAELVVGPGLDPRTQVGPLVSAQARDEISRRVEAALDSGATLAYRGTAPGEGFYYPPTVLTEVPADSVVLRGETFGPVAPIVTWSDESALVDLVNDNELGLAGYVYSGELQRAIRLAERLEVGMVGINRGVVSDPSAPFGGLKQSGLGREGAREGLREYQETQYLSISWAE